LFKIHFKILSKFFRKQPADMAFTASQVAGEGYFWKNFHYYFEFENQK